MGADVSTQEWYVDSTVAYETESYKLLKGAWSDGTKISVFGAKNGQDNMESLLHSSKMLRTLRHPCIMKHIQSCKLNGCFYLITEDVIPLEILLSKQEITLVEIIAGLHDILSALDFLHDKCSLQHNNVGTASIFVAANGSWKLGGFEDASKYDVHTSDQPLHANDILMYGELVVHLLNIPYVDDSLADNGGVAQFLERVTEECLNPEPGKRTTSNALCSDVLFRNDFVEIKSFLQNLILKPEEQKTEFFQFLNKRLSAFSSTTIASHVLPLVWSRLVFLEPSARKHFLPCLLRPKQGKSTSSGLLPADLYKEYVIPKLLKILHVHDHQVRLLILDHFDYFAHLFSKEELHETVLPEILLGVRDSSNDMVASSLRALATLVNLLGASVVIGQNNKPIFTDNRPNKSERRKDKKAHADDVESNQPTKVNLTSSSPLEAHVTQSAPVSDSNMTSTQEFQPHAFGISERSSPDGGESAEDETWSDWEDEKEAAPVQNLSLSPQGECDDGTTSVVKNISPVGPNVVSDNESVEKIKAKLADSQPSTGLGEEFDIMALDIKVVKNKTDFDYFSDMEPKLLPFYAQESLKTKNEHSFEDKKLQTLFSVLSNGTEQECAGWDDSELQVDW